MKKLARVCMGVGLFGGVWVKRIRRLLWVSLVAVALSPASALARAGGGGGYSGGGGGGGGGGFGGGGGSGGGGALIYFFFWLIVNYPVIGIPLALAIVAGMVYAGSKGSTQGVQHYRGRQIRRHRTQQDHRRHEEGLRQLREKDPAFDEHQLASRVGDAFRKIQRAWSAQELSSIRAFVSDGIYERFSLQIEEQRDEGYRNVMDNVRVHSARIAEVICDTTFDVVALRIDASATDYRVALETGREISGSRREEKFIEYWSFVRRGGAVSVAEPGLIEGSCPNCGATIEMTQSDRCQSCESLLFSGEHDWVLAEITQECEWQPGGHAADAVVAAYRATRDPAFNVQHLEDRASVIFWRKAMADRLGDIRPLAKMASEEFCETYASPFQSSGEERHYLADCAAGAVELCGVLPGEEFDRALVAVHWEGSFTTVRSDGTRTRRTGRSLRRDLFVLGRKSGVQASPDQAIRSAHCPSCGAPQSRLTSHACDFCDTVLNDGSHDWVLLEIQQLSSAKAQELIRDAKQFAQSQATVGSNGATDSTVATPQGTALLAWTIHLALADHELDAEEEKLIRHVATTRHIPANRVDAMISGARSGQLDVPEPETPQEGRQWLEAMADAGLADGRIDKQEAKLLAQAGTRLEYSRHDVQQLIRRRQRVLYQNARAEARQQVGGNGSL